jgi:hypothetical protein
MANATHNTSPSPLLPHPDKFFLFLFLKAKTIIKLLYKKNKNKKMLKIRRKKIIFERKTQRKSNKTHLQPFVSVVVLSTEKA